MTRPSWLAIALVASAGLNLFLIAAAATWFVLAAHGPRPGAAQRATLRSAAASLSPAHRAAFVAVLKAQGARVQAETRQARGLREAGWAALAAPSPDPGAPLTWRT